MSKPSFPARHRLRRRLTPNPLTPAQREARGRHQRQFAAGLILGVGLMCVYTVRDVPVAAVILGVLTVSLLVVAVDPDRRMYAAVAPLADVHTPPAPELHTPHVPPGADTTTALLDSVGVRVYGRHSDDRPVLDAADTTTLPAVTP